MADPGTLPGGVPSPAYCYDLDEVRRSHQRLRRALPKPSHLYYSLKANPHPAIITALRQAGCRAEVSSPGEMQAALDCGVPPAEIIFTAPGKPDSAVASAVAAGVGLISVDSPRALDQVNVVASALGRQASCLLRVNDTSPAPGQAMTMTGEASQFGADVEWVLGEPWRFSSRPAARVAGLHLFMGSNVAGEDDLIAQFAQAAGTARRLAGTGAVAVEMLDLGGGFGAPFARHGDLPAFPTLAARLERLLDEQFPHWRDGRPAVAFESGRYLTATCGTLLCRVLDVKRSHGRPVVVLESGINHLGGMSGMRRLPPILPDLDGAPADGAASDSAPSDGAANGEPMRGAIVSGPLCTPLDTWTKAAALAAQPGQLVRVPNVGAYGLTASLLAFLSHPAPAEVIIDGGEITHVSRLTVTREVVSEGRVTAR
jgi:diaminopimelate decarboxylase